MTAEIALLNKVAVALAADSAATISAGQRNEKVFNSEDKLFELSNTQPIGIMIYNSPSFLETPIQILIKNYRGLNRKFKSIDDAARDFREYLNRFGQSLAKEVKQRAFERLANEPMNLVSERFTKKVQELNRKLAQSQPGAQKQSTDYEKIFDECVDFYSKIFERAGAAEFSNRAAIKAIEAVRKSNEAGINRRKISKEKKERARKSNKLVELFLKSDISSGGATGIVIAGFADAELFPSLRSFVIDGMVADSLRFMEITAADITFEGNRARILPYAQQDMVDRFVCGIDQKSQAKIEKFARNMIQAFSSELLTVLGVSDEDKPQLESLLQKAEESFEDALRTEGFAELKKEAKSEIEEMIEFMPKSELAQMAESLVELTSVKKRVSKGFDTVGGPVDVAIISRSEGFVWIKRKHYFDPDKNARYFARLSSIKMSEGSESDGSKPKAASARARGRAQASRAGRPRPRKEDAKV